MKLTRGQTTVLVGLAALLKEKQEQDDEGGVRVKELADWLNKSPSSIRTSLNQLASEGLATSEPLKTTLKTPENVDPREKVWKMTYSLNKRGVNEMIKDHPEITDHLQIKEIEQLLDVDLEENDQIVEGEVETGALGSVNHSEDRDESEDPSTAFELYEYLMDLDLADEELEVALRDVLEELENE